MGTFEFKLPDIGEGVVEGEVVEWLVAVGDSIKEDDPILSVMTDKATVEIPAPCEGTVKSMVGEAGDILPVGAVCIVFEVDGDGNAGEEKAEIPAPAKEEKPAKKAEAATPSSTNASSRRSRSCRSTRFSCSRYESTRFTCSPPTSSLCKRRLATCCGLWPCRTHQSCRPGPTHCRRRIWSLICTPNGWLGESRTKRH